MVKMYSPSNRHTNTQSCSKHSHIKKQCTICEYKYIYKTTKLNVRTNYIIKMMVYKEAESNQEFPRSITLLVHHCCGLVFFSCCRQCVSQERKFAHLCSTLLLPSRACRSLSRVSGFES